MCMVEPTVCCVILYVRKLAHRMFVRAVWALCVTPSHALTGCVSEEMSMCTDVNITVNYVNSLVYLVDFLSDSF